METEKTETVQIGFAIRDEQWASNLQQGLESYMETLYESVEASMDDPEFDAVTESGEAFCGCNVCEGREILSFVVPRTIEGYLNGSVTFYRDNEEIAPPTGRQENV